MKIERWIRLGVLSMTLVGGISFGAEMQQWRPSPGALPPAMVGMPVPPPMPPGLNDARFRPVPPGSFVMPPQPPMPYPGRPFVSVQGQYAPPPPAFVRQYAWRPAERPRSIHRRERMANAYPPPYPMPMAPPAQPMMPYGPYMGGMGYPSAPVGFMPPPPMPYPPAPPMMTDVYPGMPYQGFPGTRMYPYAPPSPPWGMQPYPGAATAGYPPVPAPLWAPAWPAAAPTAWNGPAREYRAYPRYSRPRGGLGTGFSVAGLY